MAEGARRRGVLPALVGIGALFAVTALSINALIDGDLPFLGGPEGCTATVDGRSVELSLEQAENASLIAAISVQRGLPARAASIALATAYQESDLHNIDYGDRDSLGLFQQRPSQGWGSRPQILDPVYATNAFYDALVGIDGYRDLEITVAAQTVQRSGYPDAYADHEGDARVLASALTGQSRASFACRVDDDAEKSSSELNARGLTERADVVRADVRTVFGDIQMGGFEPGGVSSGHMEGSAHYDGRAIDLFFRPVNEANKTRGWALAQYLVAHAARLQVHTVIFDDRIWVAGKDDSWRDYRAPTNADPRTQAILEHRDHVHVDVFE